MVHKIDQFLMNSNSLQDIGSTIVSDTLELESHLQSFWQQPSTAPNGEGGKSISCNNLPACLQDDFKNYELHQKSELYGLLRSRQYIGQLLVDASSLMDFQAQLSQRASINIYSANTCYKSGSIPDYLWISDTSESSESK